MNSFFAPATGVDVALQKAGDSPPPPDPVEMLTLLGSVRDDALLTTKATGSLDIEAGQPVVVIVNVSVTSAAMAVSDGTNIYTGISGNPFTWGTGGRISVFICENPVAVTGPITATWTTGGRVQIAVFQGVNLTNSGVLGVNPAVANATSIGMDPVSSGTLPTDNEVLFAVLTHAGAPSNFVNDAAWTTSLTSPGAGNTDFRVSQRVVSSSDAVTYDATWDNSRQYGAKLFSLKGA